VEAKMNPKLIPTVMMIEMLAAAIVYYLHGDVRHGTYWLAGAILNLSVTY